MKSFMFFCERHVNQIERYNLEQKTSNRRDSKIRVDKFDHAVNREIFPIIYFTDWKNSYMVAESQLNSQFETGYQGFLLIWALLIDKQ